MLDETLSRYVIKLLFFWFILVAGAGFTQIPTLQKTV
jgi:hypothetical protein